MYKDGAKTININLENSNSYKTYIDHLHIYNTVQTHGGWITLVCCTV